MRVSAKTDYALRAAVELAAAWDDGRPVKGERLSTTQSIPLRFLENILLQLRHAGIVESRRGADGGYKLARDPGEITLADVIRAIDGPLAGVSGRRPETLDFQGRSEPLREVWVAVRASLRSVLEQVTLADVAGGELPANVRELTSEPDAWVSH
jgi:Rrf2 family protein